MIMKGSDLMKKLLCMILLISAIMLSSCSSLGFGASMPDLETYAAFENDTWLIIDHFLINKQDKTVCLLEANTDTDDLPSKVWRFYYYGPYAYEYIFEESSFKEYTYLKTASTKSGETLYYECVLTYSYEGKEIERSYIGEGLTEQEMKDAYKSNPSNVDAFAFEVDMLWKYHKEEYEDVEKQAILTFAEELYNAQVENNSTVMGLSKPMGEERWFSVVVSHDSDFNSGEPLFGGISKSEIKSYNAETNEIETVYEFNKKGKQIIDFDENGMYILDSNGNFSYVDYETKKSTLIYKFSGRIYSFEITDKYICAYHGGAVDGDVFVYEKGACVIADDPI